MIYANGGYASADLKGTYCSAIDGQCGPAAPTSQNGAARADGWYAGGGLDFMVHKGALVDVLLGVEYQHFDVSNGDQAFCAAPNCGVPHWANYGLSAKGDLVRAKLTIKTQGYAGSRFGPDERLLLNPLGANEPPRLQLLLTRPSAGLNPELVSEICTGR